jgi:hypothetical protein
MKGLKGFMAGVFIIGLMASPLLAGEGGYEDYTIKKGDTLWDITGERLSDSFLWPKVWKENPGIKNPDLIYPGQKIRIPLYLMQKQVELPPPAAGVTETGPSYEKIEISPRQPFVVKADLMAASGFISREVPSVGKVAATPTGRTIIGRDDIVYLSINDGGDPAAGSRFYTIRSYGEVKHPKTGETLGNLVEITGVVKVLGKEAGYLKATVDKSFTDIEVGENIDRYYPIESFPLLKGKALDVHGTIVEARHLRLLNGMYDLVYIDRGTLDGVKPGGSFTILSEESPHRPIGKAHVISAGKTTAVAMVTTSEIEINRGDYF